MKSELIKELKNRGWMFDSGYWISPVEHTTCETLDEAWTLHCSYLAEGWYIQKKQKEPKTNDSKLKAIDKVLNENDWNLSACIKIREILDGRPMKMGLCLAPIMEKQACCKSNCDGCGYYS